jgi:hypothetical protein
VAPGYSAHTRRGRHQIATNSWRNPRPGIRFAAYRKSRSEQPVPGLTTLHDAADYIQKLSKAEQQLPRWQAAVEALIMAAEGRGPLLHARVGMLRALNHGVERVFSDRKDTHWGKRKLARDRWPAPDQSHRDRLRAVFLFTSSVSIIGFEIRPVVVLNRSA